MPFRKVDVPEGESGPWKVARFTPEGFSAVLFNAKNPARALKPGETYTQLTRNGTVVMSDTPAEIRDHYSLAGHLRGRLLFNGLGLGVAMQGALDQPEVDHLTVVEISSNVLSLVASHYMTRYGNRLTIVHADALEWKPPPSVRYDAVWHDIWDDICGDNWPSMMKLHRKYGRRCDWQDSWCRDKIRSAK